MARKSGFVRRGNAMRREMLWFGGAFTATAIASASGSVLMTSLNAAALAFRPFTIVRNHAYLHINSDQVGVSENYSVAFGKAVVSDQAVDVGITALPTPVADNASDLWFFHQILMSRFLFADGTGLSPNIGIGGSFDSKAMRKVEDGQDVVSVVETTAISSGVDVFQFYRMLVKLH